MYFWLVVYIYIYINEYEFKEYKGAYIRVLYCCRFIVNSLGDFNDILDSIRFRLFIYLFILVVRHFHCDSFSSEEHEGSHHLELGKQNQIQGLDYISNLLQTPLTYFCSNFSLCLSFSQSLSPCAYICKCDLMNKNSYTQKGNEEESIHAKRKKRNTHGNKREYSFENGG